MAEDVTLTIDGKEITVPKGTLVIRAAEMLGITIPRFCDHPLLDPIGACRQCMVEVEGQRKPFTSCTTTCTPDMVVKTHLTSEVARQAQEGQLEFLLINHPLDCPQCDKGGECPLQDQTLAHGPPDTRLVDQKRRFDKPIAISAQVLLDRERCVLCARCTRFSQQISGDPFIELFERGALEQVAIYEDEPYESYFSGNVIQICPVGALTSSGYRFKSRPFDLTTHDSVCNQCSAGCNLRVDVRRNVVQRQLARDNMAVNESWSCDKGRFGFDFLVRPERLREPRARDHLGAMHPTSWLQALQRAADGLSGVIEADGPDAVGVLSGGRITDEDAYALSRFARDVVGTDNVDFRLAPRPEEEMPVLPSLAGRTGVTYDDVEAAEVIVVAGLDSEEEVPILHLRLRKAWRKHRRRIVVVGPVLGSLEGIAWRWVRTDAGQEARALAALAGGQAPESVADIAEALRGAERTVVLAGERLAKSPGALHAAAALAADVDAGFAWVPRRTNARGALDAGLLPGLLPGGRALADPGPVAEAWGRLPETPGLDTRGILEAAAAGKIKALYLVGVDPARDFEDPELARAALAKAETVIVQDLLPTATTRFADVILPACAAQERVGSFTTWEGRRQPFAQAVLPQGLAQQDWDITRQLALAMGHDLGWETAGDVRREAAPLMEAAGAGLGAAPETAAPGPRPADTYDAVLVEPLLGEGTMLAGAEALKQTARVPAVWISPSDAERLGVSDGRHVVVVTDHGRVELPAKVTAAVVAGCVRLPRRTAVADAAALGSDGALRVRLEVAEGYTPVAYPKRLPVVETGEERRSMAAGAPGDAGSRGSGPEEAGSGPRPGGAA
jgi:NADH-quinone oxidoreductase subunit G